MQSDAVCSGRVGSPYLVKPRLDVRSAAEEIFRLQVVGLEANEVKGILDLNLVGVVGVVEEQALQATPQVHKGVVAR
jgi:hypothetical protein